ncbi:MAG: CDP-alcohol phosphatidyltransferase family protein [Lewinellaceae bacterium]|nr:CDP-alcohol phosphatidyltransferase family protein [Lewinellaceae bacterium]
MRTWPPNLRMLTQLPNTITLFNLFFGVCALIQVANHRPDLALWFLLGSFACDTADGLIARALKVSGPLGVARLPGRCSFFWGRTGLHAVPTSFTGQYHRDAFCCRRFTSLYFFHAGSLSTG